MTLSAQSSKNQAPLRSVQRMSDRERQYVLQVLDNQFRTRTPTKFVNQLEADFARRFAVKHAIAHVNGTATMHAALAAANVGIGDEVIVPPLTMASTSLAVLHAGATPVFADVDPETFNIDPASIRRCITPRTRAIIPVALYGLSADMDAIMTIADEHRLCVIEDVAECFLGYYKGRLAGTIGHLGSFSFQSTKHMTCGEGGMVVSNDTELANRTRQFSSLGYATATAGGARLVPSSCRQDPGFERHTTLGWNYRMSELCAAVALGQLEHLEELVAIRQAVAKAFAQRVEGCSWLIPQNIPNDCVSAHWTFVVRLEADTSHITWRSFSAKFNELGGDPIYAAWQLTHLEPLFRQLHDASLKRTLMCCGIPSAVGQPLGVGLCPVAERLQPRLMQFKTNYFDLAEAERQADVLAKTIAYFD